MTLKLIDLPKPKRFSDVTHSKNFTFSSVALDKRPNFAGKVALTIARIAEVDQLSQMILISLLKLEAKAAIDELRKLRNAYAKEKRIDEIIDANADQQLRTTFDTIKPLIKDVRVIRNKFAHNAWGESAEIADKILLTEPENLNFSYGLAKHLQAAFKTIGTLPNLEIFDLLNNTPRRDDIEVWDAADFDAALESAAGAVNAMNALLVCADRGIDKVPELHSALREYGLLSLPPHLILGAVPNA
jgi:hypothetical protein